MNKLIDLINKNSLSKNERIELLDELYWADLTQLGIEYPEEIKKIFNFLRNSEFSIEEISLIQKLYSNPEGAYVEEFTYIITKLYMIDRIMFIKALHLNIDEAESLAYMFRNNRVFRDGDIELKEILETNLLTDEEQESANTFFKMYEKVCNTWG